MGKKHLDFLIIGAMRSGTTTLHELLKQHPHIALPPGKEVPFFNDDYYYKKGLDWYIESNFTHATSKQQLGTITPQYMFSPDGFPTQQTVDRIKHHLPNVKLIAVLRHPIERAYSNYQLVKRRSLETRSFEEAMNDILISSKESLLHNPKVSDLYLLRSMYGEQLAPYYKEFSKDQILIIFTDELKNEPKETFRRIVKFINVETEFAPKNIGETFHKGGGQAKIRWLTPGKIGKLKTLRKIYRHIVPYQIRKRFEIWLYVWNTKPDNSQLDPDSEVYKQLIEYFKTDVKLLESLVGKKTPWKDWQ